MFFILEKKGRRGTQEEKNEGGGQTEMDRQTEMEGNGRERVGRKERKVLNILYFLCWLASSQRQVEKCTELSRDFSRELCLLTV